MRLPPSVANAVERQIVMAPIDSDEVVHSGESVDARSGSGSRAPGRGTTFHIFLPGTHNR